MREGQASTGTRDETYDIIAVLYHALQGAENCERYKRDASGDDELSSFFDEAKRQQRELADRGKQLLQRRLQKEGGGQQGESAFSFSQGQQQAGSQPQGQQQGSSRDQDMGENQPRTGQTGGGAGGRA